MSDKDRSNMLNQPFLTLQSFSDVKHEKTTLSRRRPQISSFEHLLYSPKISQDHFPVVCTMKHLTRTTFLASLGTLLECQATIHQTLRRIELTASISCILDAPGVNLTMSSSLNIQNWYKQSLLRFIK